MQSSRRRCARDGWKSSWKGNRCWDNVASPDPLVQESVDKQMRPSIRRQKKAATRGERFNICGKRSENPFAPSRPRFLRGRIEGLPRRKSTVPQCIGKRVLAIILLLIFLLFRTPAAEAQTEAPNLKAAKLAEEFSDPLTTLPQIFAQDAYTPTNYGTDAQTNRVIVERSFRASRAYSLLAVRPTHPAELLPRHGADRQRQCHAHRIRRHAAVRSGRHPVAGEGERSVDGQLGRCSSFRPRPTSPRGRAPGRSGRPSGRSTRASRDSCSAAWSRIPSPSPTLAGPPAPEHPPVPTDRAHLHQAGLLREIRRRHVEHRLAQRHGDDVAPESRARIRNGARGRPPINVFVSGEWMAYRQDAPVAPQTTVRFGLTVAFPEWSPW